MFQHVTRSHLCWQLLLFAEGRLMDPSVVATAGSAAVVAVNDQASGATRSAAEQGQDHVVQGQAALQGQTNGYPQDVAGKGKHTDGRTTEALPHQERQVESRDSLLAGSPGELITTLLNSEGATDVLLQNQATGQGLPPPAYQYE